VIADDTAAHLKANLAGDVLSFGFDSEADAIGAIDVIRELTDRDVSREGVVVTFTAPDGDELLPAIVRRADAAGISVRRATGVPPTLDDVFLALTGRTLRDAGAPDSSEGEADEENVAAAMEGADR
jgi:hypothetical protein